MQAKVKHTFYDREKKQTFQAGSDWSGTKERFEAINEGLKIRFKSATLDEVKQSTKKESKPKTETKELKLETETKSHTSNQ